VAQETTTRLPGRRPAARQEQDIMSDTLTYQRLVTAARSQAHASLAQAMGYVAPIAGPFAPCAWAGQWEGRR
jgi:hypothetical protein